MQEALKKVTSNTAEPVEKTVTLCIRSQKIRLSGIWNWEMLSPAVYCSDVMSFPDEFIGTKGIFHPDDLPRLMGALTLMEEKEMPRLDFRIITTYGEVKTISGQRVSIDKESNRTIEPIPGKEPWEEVLQLIAAQKETDFLRLRRELSEYTEHLHGIGSWLINRQSGQTWYSDNVFRIHGVAIQSLNPHSNTFNPFIHKEDRVAVLDAFEKAYQEQAPLHIEYRIVLPDAEVRHIQQITKWFYSADGQEIVSGIVRDVTEERAIADQLSAAQTQSLLYQQVLKIAEEHSTTGYWVMDLATRKTSYSDNYFRIYGFKKLYPPNYNSFVNLVDGEDRKRVRDLIEKMYHEHTLPETEFCIIRPDGRKRHIRQSGRLFISPNHELIMIGVVQDVSVQKGLEKKILELNEHISLNRVITEMMEQTAEMGSFVWLPDGSMQWSDGFYRMLGYKPGGMEPLPRLIYKNIYPADLKVFKDAETMLLNGQNHEDLVIRLVSKNGIRKVKLSFRHINDGKEATVVLVHDISKQTEWSEQFAGNQLFTGILEESVNDMIIFSNTDNTITHWNKAAEEKTGIAKNDALFQNLFDVLPQLKEEGFLGQMHLAVRGTEGHASMVNTIYLKQSHDYWLWPVKNEQGDVLGVLHVVHDISRQLELQQQLSERLNFIESLIEASVDRIVVLDRFMNYLYWNKKAEEYYVISKERVLGKNILQIFPAFRNDPGYQQFRTVLKGETVYLPPLVNEDTDEYFETYLIPIKDENHDVTAVLWIVHDLSREYRLTKERKQTVNLLYATMDASQDMIQVFEAVRNEDDEIVDFRYVLINHEAEKWIPDAVGKTLLQLQPGVVEEGIFETFKRVVETGVPDQSERHYVHEQFNGWFYQSTVKLNDGVATTTRNITDRKKAEEEVIRAKELLKATLNSTIYVIQAFRAVRDEAGRIIDFEWTMNNHKGIEQNGDVIGERLLERNPGVVASGLFQKFVEVTETGVPVDHEVFYDYEQFNAWYHQILVKMDDGFVMSTEDITERKKAEQELKESKDLVQSVFDVSLNPIAYHKAVRDASGKIVDFEFQLENFEARKYAVEDLTRKKYSEAYPGIKDTEVFQLYCHVVETGKELNTEVQINLKGTDRWFHLMGVKLNDGLVATALDITERKKAEQEILRLRDEVAQKATDKYYSIFNSIDEGFCIYELVYDDKGELVDLRWLEVNPAYEKQTGLKNIVGRSHNDLSLATEKYWFDIYDSVAKTGEAVHSENWHEPTRRWYHVFASRIGKADNKQIAVVFEDITERKRRELQQEYLLKLNDTLRSTAGSIEIEEKVMALAMEYFGADRCYYNTIEGDNSIIRRDAKKEGLPSVAGTYPLSSFALFKKLIEEGAPFVVQDVRTTEILDEPLRELCLQLQVISFVDVPVIKNGAAAGVFCLVQSSPRHWTETEIQLAVETAERTWAAVERAKAEEELRESEEKVRNFNASLEQQIEERTKELQKQLTLLRYTEYLAQSGTWEYEVGTGEFKWSEGMYKMFGLPQQTPVHPEIYMDHALAGDRAIAKKIVNLLKKKHDPFEEILRIQRKDEVRTIKVKGSVLTDEKGKVQRIIGVDVDITGIQQAEEKLKESRHWLEQTAKASPDSITVYELQKRQPIYLNDCLAEWIGADSNELVEMGVEGRLSLIHPDDRLNLLHANEKAASAKDGEIIMMEYRIRTKDDKTIWLRNRSKPFQRDASGKVTHILSILQNVTEEVELREELKRRSEYAESIIDASIDRIAVYDKELCIIAWNRRSEEVTARKKQNVLGQKLFDVFPKIAQDEELLKAHLDALEGRYVSLPAKRGVYTNNYYERFYIPLKNERKETYAIVSIMHDVSELVNRNMELKELNESLEQKNAELEQKNEEINSFAFVASHDMKEPLRKIHTFSDWLMQQETEQLSDKGKNLVEKINASVHRMEALIDDILVLTKIHSDTHREEEVNLNKILKQVFDDLFEKILMTQTGIHADELPIVKGNSNQVYYLFKNLISNAIKFQKPGNTPQITITAEIVSGEETGIVNPYDEYAKVLFADNGFGFDQRYAKKIFQVFQRLHGKHEFEGTGIGLAICKKIMDNHEGIISVESEQGKGSIFSCYFPLL